jgi:hypothetical protein
MGFRGYCVITLLAVAFTTRGGPPAGADPIETKALYPVTVEDYVKAYGRTTEDDRRLVDQEVDRWIKAPVEDRDAGEVALEMKISTRAFPLLMAAAQRQDLPLEGKAWLEDVVDKAKAWQDGRVRDRLWHKPWNDWNQPSALSAYEKFGHHDPKWNAIAVEALRSFFSDSKDRARAYKLLKQAIDAGCDDALVAYGFARESESFANREEAYARLTAAADKMLASDYPAVRKSFAANRAHQYARDYVDQLSAAGRAFPGQWDEKYKQEGHAAMEIWPQVASDKSLPPEALYRLAKDLITERFPQHSNDRQLHINWIMPPLEKALPGSALPLVVKGVGYIQFAWDGRGGDWAANVTPEQWKLFHERLEVARQALEKAWEIDPHCPAACAMLTVALGEDWPREKMELWYRRAMIVNPGDRDAIRGKLYYLEPKWHGSVDAMIQFGHECAEERNWVCGVPFMLPLVYQELLPYAPEPQKLWSVPEIWQDVQKVYLPAMKAMPEDNDVRSCYCLYACKTEHWAEAAKQFKILGSKAVVSRFGGPREMQIMKAQALAKGYKP